MTGGGILVSIGVAVAGSLSRCRTAADFGGIGRKRIPGVGKNYAATYYGIRTHGLRLIISYVIIATASV
jgi:hypothetical protein